MPETPRLNRARFLSGTALGIAGTQLLAVPKTLAQTPAPRSFDTVAQIDAGVLNVGYADVGPRDGTAVILLHGWPYDIHSYAEVAPLLAAHGYRAIVPYIRGYGETRFLASTTFRNGQQSAVALDVVSLMDALKIDKAILGGFDWGSRTADIVAALWPQRVKGLVSVSGYLITNVKAQAQPLPPKAELGWWYQYYFATERGRIGYAQNRNDFNLLIWQVVSPKWNFDNATYLRTAAAFDNPDHVDIVIHNYRWRLGLANGEARYDNFETRLFAGPVIGVPTITIASDFDGAAADGAAYRSKFTGKYDHRVLTGVGHNVPQEAPQAFAQAVMDLDTM